MALVFLIAIPGIDGLTRPLVQRSFTSVIERESVMVVAEGLWAAALGGAQWIVLMRSGFAFAAQWALATAFTTWIGASVTEVLSVIQPNGFAIGLIATIGVAGVVCGAIQTRWLRPHIRHAAWWIVALASAWILLLAGAFAGSAAAAIVIPGAFDDAIHLTIGYFVGGIAFGALTGVVLEKLLRARWAGRPLPSSNPASHPRQE